MFSGFLVLAVLVAGRDEAVSEKERAEADASAVLASVLRTLESAAGAERALDERFGAWCDSARIRTSSLADEIARQVAEAETANEQLAADQDRLRSERDLAKSALKDGTQERAAATDASAALQSDVDAETELLRRAQELANHALRLVRNREAMHTDAGLEDEASVGTGATALGLPELLSALLTEVDKQHTEVTGEQEKITDLFDNVTSQAAAAASGLQSSAETVATEGQERVRAAARFASVLADLRRLVTAVGAAANATDQVCQSERDFVKSMDGVAAAEMDKVKTVLELVSPTDPAPALAFTQLFLARGEAHPSPGLRQRFHDFVARMAQDPVASPSFASIASVLATPADTALVDTKASSKGAGAHKRTAADALREIADFSAPDQESAGDAKVADDAYRTLVFSVKKELHGIAAEGMVCRGLLANATTAVQQRARAKAFAGAQLHALNTTTTDLAKDSAYLDGQLSGLRAMSGDFDALVQLEATEFAKLSTDLRSFSQQLLTVATELAGVAEKKTGADVESLVAQLQTHLTTADSRHTAYSQWAAAVSKGAATLERVLAVDLAHARHKLQSYATDTTYLAAMQRAKDRDEVLAQQQRSAAAARCPPEQEAVRAARTAALEEQLREVTSFWTSLHV